MLLIFIPVHQRVAVPLALHPLDVSRNEQRAAEAEEQRCTEHRPRSHPFKAELFVKDYHPYRHREENAREYQMYKTLHEHRHEQKCQQHLEHRNIIDFRQNACRLANDARTDDYEKQSEKNVFNTRFLFHSIFLPFVLFYLLS